MNEEIYSEQVDNLSKYGATFQSKVLAAILTSKEFLHQSLDVLNPNFFNTDAAKWIVNTAVAYFNSYKSLPTADVFKLELETVSDPALKLSIKDELITAMKYKNDEDLTYVKDNFLDFAKNQAIQAAIRKSVDLLESGQYNKIKTIVDAALKAGQPRNIGHNWKEDFAVRISGKSRKVVPTGWDCIDNLMGGGLAAGELGVVAAPSGIGKSWALAKIGAHAAMAGYTVVHYTFELNEEYVGIRYDTIYTGIEPGNIVNNSQIVLDTIPTIAGNLIIKYYPVRSVNVHTLRAHMENLKINGLSPDLMIVDYADLMRPADRADSRHQELGVIYEELRGLAGEMGLPCWTASQTQRSSIQDEIIQADKISESYQKIMTADFVMSLSRKLEDKTTNTARVHVMKNRFGGDGITFPVYMNTSAGKIEIYDDASVKGMQLMKQMQQSEKDTKKSLLTKFNNFATDFDE